MSMTKERIPGTKIAEKLFTRSEGATMREVIAATGSPQYNLLKRLEERGHTVRKVKEGTETRYFVKPPEATKFEAPVSANGQVTVPKEIRERLGIRQAGRLRFIVDGEGRVTIAPVELSVLRLKGILGKPPRHASIEEMNEGIGRAVVDRFRRASR
jgi:antitoxin PrlF